MSVFRKPLVRSLLIAVALIELYSIGLIAVFTVPDATRALVSSYALPFDLMIFIPALFYFFIVRKNNLSLLLVLPVIWLGSFVTINIAQPSDMRFVFVLVIATLAIEALVVVKEGSRFVRAIKKSTLASPDPSNWFAPAFFELTKSKRVSKLAGFELSTLYFTFFSWRKKPFEIEDEQSFSYHKESSYAAITGVMVGIVLIETLAFHILISQWNEVVAWILTILSLTAAILVLGEYRASSLRPITVSQTAVTIRSGVRFAKTIAFSNIASIQKQEPTFEKKELMNFGVMGQASCWLIFEEPLEVDTAFGGTKHIRALGVSPDNEAKFKESIQNELII